jgi:AraC family transcriptional regulator
MKNADARVAKTPVERPAAAPLSRAIAAGDGWQIGEFTCHLGPEDRPFEEQHDQVTVAAVLEGSFGYRCDAGAALLYPGAFLLGNVGACFECGHDHGIGDRCIAFKFAPSVFEEVAATAAGSHRFRFKAAMLPVTRALAAPAVAAEAKARGAGPASEEFALRFLETVLATLAGTTEAGGAPRPGDQRRISRVLRYIEEHADQPLDLAQLAAQAFVSKYHFLRIFRRMVGVTPYQFLLDLRLRRAAVKLCTTSMPIAGIAFEVGFGDLSTFNAQFRDVFGASPSAFRRAQRAA